MSINHDIIIWYITKIRINLNEVKTSESITSCTIYHFLGNNVLNGFDEFDVGDNYFKYSIDISMLASLSVPMKHTFNLKKQPVSQ